MTRYMLVLEYDGAEFVGWQLQPKGRSVQGVVEAALEVLFAAPIRLHPTGRTDAGVHARAQVAVFDAEKARTPEQIRHALNANLPPDVAVVSAAIVADDFDPRRWVKDKRYRYTWLDRPSRSPLRRRDAWHERGPLDVQAMHAAVQPLAGRHDFTTFRAAGCTARHPVRIVDSLAVRREGDLVHLDVAGHGFLRHMVRIIAGTVVLVGQGRKPVDYPTQALDARDRAAGGRTAPAHGLVLMSVDFADALVEQGALDDALVEQGALDDALVEQGALDDDG